MASHIRCLLIAGGLSVVAHAASAETYIGGSIGWSFDQNITSVKGDENTNYPDPPDPNTLPLLAGSRISDLRLEDSVNLGLKAGYFFDQAPALGIEGEFNFARPNFRRQLVTLTHPDFVNISPDGSDHVTEDQLPAHADKFMLALNAVLRYQELEDLTPYIAGGPALFIFHVHGTGFSGSIPEFGIPGEPGPLLNETTVELGFDAKAGIEYNLGDNWAVGAEYRYEWTPISLDNFRSLSNASGHYHGSNVDLTIVKHF